MGDLSASAAPDCVHDSAAWQEPGAVAARTGKLAPLRWALCGVLMPLARLAGRAYVAGDGLEDGLRVANRHTDAGRTTTLGFFNDDTASPRAVADTYLATIRALSAAHAYVSIKLPAMGFSPDLLTEVVQQAHQNGVRLLFDSMWPAAVPETHRMIAQVMDTQACGPLSLALPGRWRRSIEDARWATRRGLLVRVVKGQWADPDDPHRDLRQGYMEVIRTLAGRAQLVAVASHDVPMAEEAIAILQEAKTPCELELLHGLPMRASLAMAKRIGVNVRVYVPFGSGHLPYAIAQVIRKPHMAWWLIKDLLGLAT